MKWRWLDRVVAVEDDGAFVGVKAVSLAEYSLGEPLGRRGALPETLAVECAVALTRWAVIVSSDFADTGAWLTSLSFRFDEEAGLGARLTIRARPAPPVDGEDDPRDARFAVTLEGLGAGELSLRRAPLAEYEDPASLRALWRAIGPDARKG